MNRLRLPDSILLSGSCNIAARESAGALGAGGESQAWTAIASHTATRRRSKRNIVMLLPGILELLVPELAQPQRDAPTRRMGHDHLVDEALARRHKRIGEALLIF